MLIAAKSEVVVEARCCSGRPPVTQCSVIICLCTDNAKCTLSLGTLLCLWKYMITPHYNDITYILSHKQPRGVSSYVNTPDPVTISKNTDTQGPSQGIYCKYIYKRRNFDTLILILV